MKTKIIMDEYEIIKQFDKLILIKEKFLQVIRSLQDEGATRSDNDDHFVLFRNYQIFIKNVFNETSSCVNNICYILRIVRDHMTEEYFLTKRDKIIEQLEEHSLNINSFVSKHKEQDKTINIIEDTYMHKLIDKFIFDLHLYLRDFIPEVVMFIEDIKDMVRNNNFTPINFIVHTL